MKDITYSAPGKVIISGEYAVVYGKPALVSAINFRLKFSLVIPAKASLAARRAGIQTGFMDPRFHGDGIGFIAKKTREYLNSQKIKHTNKPFNYKIESEIPVGRGLGSSAALSVASVAAFLEFYSGQQFDKTMINELAFEIEKYFHKNPSGVDNTASCFGGLILYKKNTLIKNLESQIPKSFRDKLFLIDSGKPEETTGEMVKSVKSVASVFDKIEIETEKILNAIKKENVDLFKQAIFNNEKLLEELGVVSEKTKKLFNNLSKFGIGKVTGAGGRKTGSGFILFYAIDIIGLENYLRINGIKYYKFIPDDKGLIRH